MKKLFSKWLSALLIAALLLPCVAVAEEASPVAAEPATGIVADDAVFEADAPEAVEPESEEPIVEDVIDEPDAAPAEDAAPVEDAEEGESASDEDPDAPVEEVIIDSVDEIVSEDDFADLPTEDYDNDELFVSEDSEWESVSSEAMDALYEGGEGDETEYFVHSLSGDASVSQSNHKKGDIVTIDVRKIYGYGLLDLAVVDSENNNITVNMIDEEHYTFVMPASDVTVSATFGCGFIEEGVDIGVNTVSAQYFVDGKSVHSAYPGTEVSLQLVKDSEVTVTEVRAVYGDDMTKLSGPNADAQPLALNKIDELNYTFIMPEGFVNIIIEGFYGEPPQTYISNDVIMDGGHVNVMRDGASVFYATYGDCITLDVQPDYGYELDTLTVKRVDRDTEIEIAADNTFIMPARSVTVSATFKVKSGYYRITANGAENGYVGFDKRAAETGDTVIIIPDADNGYELDTLTVVDSEGNEIPVSESRFTMPASDVTVTATFKRVYNVYINSDGNGYLNAGKGKAGEGDIVTIDVSANDGYVLDTLTVVDSQGNPISVGEDKTFVMPADDVTVSATFKADEKYSFTESGTLPPSDNPEEQVSVQYIVDGQSVRSAHPGDKVTVQLSKGDKVIVNEVSAFYADDMNKLFGPNADMQPLALNREGELTYTFDMPAAYVGININASIEGQSQGGESSTPGGLQGPPISIGENPHQVNYPSSGEGFNAAVGRDGQLVSSAAAGTDLWLYVGASSFGFSITDANGDVPYEYDGNTGGYKFTMRDSDVTIDIHTSGQGGQGGESGTPGGLQGPPISIGENPHQVNYPSSGEGFNAAVGRDGQLVSSAAAGTDLWLYVGASSFGFSITDANGDVPYEYDGNAGGYKFTMRDSDVTIDIHANTSGPVGPGGGEPVPVEGGEFAINIVDSEYGKAYAQRNGTYVLSANANDSIRIEPRPNQYYQPTGVTVTDENGNVLNGAGMGDPWVFTMPDGPVTVTVNFVESHAIAITEENFPDENLRNRLLMMGAHQMGPDPTLYVESGNVNFINLENVENFKGLELFNNLKQLQIIGYPGTALELALDSVESIMLANCENLTSVDLSGCPNLNDVNFEWNTPKIASLDVSGCTKLTSLLARGAALTELDVSHNTELVKLDCNSNQLTELDVSNNTKLETLSCFNNNIKELNLANNPEIQKYVDDQYKQNINDTQEGYTCIAYVNPNADPWDAWVLAHDHGVEITLAPVFAIARTVTENGASGTIDAPASASANQTVTVTLTPDENSVAGEIKVAFGETEVPATFADGKYTFTMPEGDVTITATFKKRPKVEAPVAAENLTYDGSEQALVVAGTTDGGTLQYSLDGEAWSEDIPVGKAAGDYEVYYRALGNGDFGDYAAEAPVAVAIAKAKATVTIDKKKTYGDNDPDTSDYTVDGLVSGDTLTGDPEREKGENVKRYAYNAGTLDNPNYDITVEGNLTILPKEISAFEWSTDPFTYNGEAQFPTATVSEGLVEGDECSVTVVAKDGDDATEAGDHTAIVVSLSNGNYKLPKTAIEHTYTIEKADHEDVKDGVQFAISANGVENGQADLSQYIPEDAEWFVTGCDNKLITTAEIKTGDEKSRILTYTAVKAAADVTEGCVELEIKEKDYNPYDLIVKFVTSDVFTLSFDSKGGDPVDSLKLHQGVPYGELPKLERDYYTFEGWVDSANNEVTAETEMGAGDTTIFAKWEAIEYTIALDLNGHSAYPEGYTEGKKTFTIEDDVIELDPLNDVEEEGKTYTFSGWLADGEQTAYTDVSIDPAEALKNAPEDKTFKYTAQWTEGTMVGNVTYTKPEDDLSGILGIKDMDAEASTDGESSSNSLAETLKQIAADNSNDDIPAGTEVASKTVTVNMAISATDIDEDGVKDILDQVEIPAVEDVDVKTDFVEIVITQTTSYTAEGEGEVTGEPKPLSELNRVVEIPLSYDMTGRYNLRLFRKHGDSVEPFTKLPERPKSGKDMQDGTFFVSGYGASAVIYIYSDKFSTFAASTDNRESFEVNFVSNGGSEVEPQPVYKGEKVTKPADPTRAATATVVYTFDGWYTDEALTEKYDFDATPVTEAFTLYAGWKETAVPVNNPAPVVASPAPAPAPAADPILTIISNKKNVKATVEVGKVYQIDLLGKSGKGYKSSKKKLATVSSTGLVTPKNAGKVKITFKVGKKKRTITLKVVDPTVPKSIALSLAGTVPAKVGEPQTLTYTLSAGSESGVKWKTSNKKIATVNNGVVTFKKAGTVTITATCTRGKKKAKVKFKVSK